MTGYDGFSGFLNPFIRKIKNKIYIKGIEKRLKLVIPVI